ncbi:MAG: hypothetical protein MJ150_03870 [Clostridia bacterium]|nr:hypothetical protein [Clostridia bacterium]
MNDSKKKMSSLTLLGASIRLLVVALVAVSTITFAWFTISDNTRVSMLSMDVTTGKSLRIDVEPHALYEDYKQSLPWADINNYVKAHRNVDYDTVPLEPVTSKDAKNFYTQKGAPVYTDQLQYIEYVLHFKSQDHVLVHLTEANSAKANDGTKILSPTAALPRAMRIGFEMPDGSTHIYRTNSEIDYMQQDATTLLFDLPADTDLPVTVRIWIEGTDPACTNALKGKDYTLMMRFIATDLDFRAIE